MKIDIIGSFITPENLDSSDRLADVVDRQIEAGLQYVTAGELTRRYWDKDFYFGLDGISCEHIDSGRVYQDVKVGEDLVRINGRIAFAPSHPCIAELDALRTVIGDRALPRVIIPSPCNLYLEILSETDGHPERIYPSTKALIVDIAHAWHDAITSLYDHGCRSILLDDTAFAALADYSVSDALLQGGCDTYKLGDTLITLFNHAIDNLPADLETAVYISNGRVPVPHWHDSTDETGILSRALAQLNVNKFFLPFDPGQPEALAVLSHVASGAEVVLGLLTAHSPFDEDTANIQSAIDEARARTQATLSLGMQTGFRFSSHLTHGLTADTQWDKLATLRRIAR